MAKKKVGRKKPAKKSTVAKHRRGRLAKPQRPTKRRRTAKPPKPKTPKPEYGPAFFLTAESDTAPAFELDATPHPKTIQSYRLENADIREFEELDGKILYKVKPLKPPRG